MEDKKMNIKKIVKIAIIVGVVIGVIFSIVKFSVSRKNNADNTTATKSVVASTSASETVPTQITTTEAAAATMAETVTQKEVTAPKVTTTKKETTTHKVTTTKKVTTTQKVTTTRKVTTTAKPTTTQKPTTTKAMPSSIAQIVDEYNKATKIFSAGKPGFTKVRSTAVTNLNLGALTSLAADAVKDFLGNGTDTVTVSKGQSNSGTFKSSTLTASDVSSATCKKTSDGKYYEINIRLKGDTMSKGQNGIVGKVTRDFKTVDEAYAGLDELGAKVDSITANTSGSTIYAKVEIRSGKIVSLKYHIIMDIAITNIKYSILSVKKATGLSTTDVTYNSVKW